MNLMRMEVLTEQHWINSHEKRQVINTRIIGGPTLYHIDGPTMFHINPPVRCDDLKQVWKTILLEHPSLRAFFYKNPKTNNWEKGIYKEEEVEDLMKYFIDQSGISVDQQKTVLESVRSYLLQEISGCRWRCFVGKTEKYNQTFTLIVDHLIFDGFSYRILENNLEGGIAHLEKTGKVEIKHEVHSILQYTNTYGDYMFSLPPHRLEAWRTLLRQPLFSLPPQDGNPLSNQPRISITTNLPLSQVSLFHDYLRRRHISVFTGAVTLILMGWRKVTGQTHGILPITTHGRTIPPERRDFIGKKFDMGETMGNLASGVWVEFSLGDESFDEEAKRIGKQLAGMGERSVEWEGLYFLKRKYPHIDIPTTNEEHSHGLSINFMQNKNNSKRIERVPGLLKPIQILPKDIPKPIPSIRIWWSENLDGISILLFYNEQFHSKSVAQKVLDAILLGIGLCLEEAHSNL